MNRKLAPVAVLALVTCGGGPRAENLKSQSAALLVHEYGFVVSSSGSVGAGADRGLVLASLARGHMTLTVLDDPPLLVGALTVEQLRLRSDAQLLASVEPGVWPFLARHGGDGAVDMLWLDDEVPGEAVSVLRFVVAELQIAAPGVLATREQTPAGAVEARYAQRGLPGLRMGLRARGAVADLAAPISGGAVFASDGAGLRSMLSTLHTRMGGGGGAELASSSVLLIRRESTAMLSDADVEVLREQIERLSAGPPVSVIEQPLSRQKKLAIRREAEAWESVQDRLLSAGDPADPTVLGRAAAYLVEDDALARELLALVGRPSTPGMGASAMLDALGECGTPACQDALLAGLAFDEPLATASLAALTRIVEPSAETVDALLEVAETGDELIRASAGVVLGRFGEGDGEGAAARVRAIVEGLDGCPAGLDGWFGLLGNAGSRAAKPALSQCLAEGVPASRRAAALAALRRVPGEDVTRALIDEVGEQPGAIRLAGLRALFGRELSDRDLDPLASAEFGEWSAPELNSLLDLLERVAEPGKVVLGLVEAIGECSHAEVATRARTLAQVLGR